MKHIGEVLEKIKQMGSYNVACWYGDGIGCDDIDMPAPDRKILLIWNPIGYLGEVRCMWAGTLKDALAFDWDNSSPVKVSNPPQKKEVGGFGYWAWGADLIDEFMKKFA